MPGPRFTLRWLMVAVAIAGLALGVLERHWRFTRISAEHAAALHKEHNPYRVTKTELWHTIMAMKYELAAKRPWLPVAPDPPEPK